MAQTFIRYTDDVDTLADAWTFALTHVDGFTAPTIEIQAFTRIDYNSEQKFAVSIHGHV